MTLHHGLTDFPKNHWTCCAAMLRFCEVSVISVIRESVNRVSSARHRLGYMHRLTKPMMRTRMYESSIFHDNPKGSGQIPKSTCVALALQHLPLIRASELLYPNSTNGTCRTAITCLNAKAKQRPK